MSVKSSILLILDGWGYQPPSPTNAITLSKTPCLDELMQAPYSLLGASGLEVGLPPQQMGNSEVGHLTLGAGRCIPQDLSRINAELANGRLQQHPALLKCFTQAYQSQKSVHIIGLLSPGGVHAHEDHLLAILAAAQSFNIDKLYIHVLLDGRDCPPKSALESIGKLQKQLVSNHLGQIASVCGRFYALDRDLRWERIEPVYQMLTQVVKGTERSIETVLEQTYASGQSDEFILPHRLLFTPNSFIKENDCVIFTHFRADRARQLTDCLSQATFDAFKRPNWQAIELITLTQYDARFDATVLYQKPALDNLLSHHLSRHGLKQLKLAETEKFAHVTYFFNGGQSVPHPLETFKMIPSLKVATYDLAPKMCAQEITQALIEAIARGYDFIVCNFANADMVGHTGNISATINACEFVDKCVSQIKNAAQKYGVGLFITADHGNAEALFDPLTNQAHTYHTCSPVPFIYTGPRKALLQKTGGSLKDVAPTLLAYMNLPKPNEMTGQSLITFEPDDDARA